MRIAAPPDRPRRLRPEPDQPAVGRTSDAHDDRPGRHVLVLREVVAEERKLALHEGVPGSPAGLVDQARDHLIGRAVPHGVDAAAAHHRRSRRAHDVEEDWAAGDDLVGLARRRLRDRRTELLEQLQVADPATRLVGVEEDGEDRRGRSGHEVDGVAGAQREPPDVVEPMAGDETPQPVLDDDRRRHRRPDAHVAQVLQVHRRHGTEADVGEVDRGHLATGRGEQRHRLGGGVRDQPEAVLDVERPRLGRDVARGEAEAEQAADIRRDRLGDDLAVPLLVEAVDEDPIEAGDLLHGDHGLLEQHVAGGGAVEGLQRAVEAPVVVELDGGHRLDLQEPPIGVLPDDRLGRSADRVEPQRVAVAAGEHRGRPLGADDVGEALAEQLVRGDADDRVRVRRHRLAAAVAVDDEEGTVRLDRARAADRLGFAGGEQRREGRVVGHGPSAVAIRDRQAPILAERLVGDPHADGALPALVLGQVHQPSDPLDDRRIVAGGDESRRRCRSPST